MKEIYQGLRAQHPNVAVLHDFAVWRRFGVRAWPTLVLVDRRGIVRYRHIGEGEYAETETMIRRLLAEEG